jgi:hypothetical protein
VNGTDPASSYVRDLGRQLSELALDAKQKRDVASDDPGRMFATGRLMGLHEAISLMQEQAVAFGMPLGDVGLDGIDPERDLL